MSNDLDINYAMEDNEDYITIEPEVGEQPAEGTQSEQEEAVTTPEQPSKVNIEGFGEFTVEELREFKQGYMRQSDYTRKTQELARQRKELQELQQLEQAPIYSTPQANPNYPTNYVDPVVSRVDKLEQEIANRELDNTLTVLKSKYADFDEVKVLDTAYKMGLTDLEFVYRATREESKPEIDVNAIKEQARQDTLRELRETQASTATIITGEGSISNSAPQLTNQELIIAKNMGLTPEEYAKYK